MGIKQQRLEEIRSVLGLNKTEMATLMGIDQSYYQHILKENGKGNLRLEHLQNLLEKANVNPVWVMGQDGEPFVGKSNEIRAEGEPSPEQIEALYQYVIKQNSIALSAHQEISLKLACSQCFIDFPHLKTMRDLSIAANVYLNMIVRYPKADFVALLGIG